MNESTISDEYLKLILGGKKITFAEWQATHNSIYDATKLNKLEYARTTYEQWVGKISPRLETSILDEILKKINNVFGYPIKHGIIKKNEHIKMLHNQLKIEKMYSLLIHLDEFPMDIIRFIIQLMLPHQ